MSFVRTVLLFAAIVFAMVAYSGTLAPAIGQLTTELTGQLSSGGPFGSGSLLATIQDVLVLWLPLMFVGGFLLLLFISAMGPRGSSFRP